MATTFGSYTGSVSPVMTWYATYDYSRTSNSNVYVTVTVVGEIKNHSSGSWMGTGASVVVTATVNGSSQTYTLKDSSNSWYGNSNNPRSHTFEFNIASTTAGASIPVSYSVAGSSHTAAAKVPTQSTSFSSPALLYTASTPTMSNMDLGNAVTIYTNRQYSNMTHNIYWYFGNRSGTVGEGVTDSVTFQTYAEWADQIPSSTYGTGSIVCYTYADGVHIGTRTIYFTAYVPSSMVPSCSISVSLVRTSEPSWGIAVKGYTKYRAVVSASGTYGSWITSYYISGGGYASSSSDYTSGVLQTVGDNVITATVTDSRGRSYSSTASVYVYDYSPPYFSDVYAYRAASDGSKSNNGTYIRAGASYGYASIGGYNGISCSVQYKQNGGSYVSAGSLSSGGAVTFGSGGISLGSSYTVLFTVSDSIQSITREIGVGTASRSFHIKRGGKGIAFGKIAETDNLVDSAWNVKAPGFDGNIVKYNPILVPTNEANEISGQENAAGSLGDNLLGLRNSLDFRWYDSHWQIGNLRSSSYDSAGFGFAFSGNGGNASGDTFELKAKVDNDGAIWQRNAGYKCIDTGNYMNYALPLSGGTVTGLTRFDKYDNGTSPGSQNIFLANLSGENSVARNPGIGFYIPNVNWGSLKFLGDGSFRFYNPDCNNYYPVYASTFYGEWSGYSGVNSSYLSLPNNKIVYHVYEVPTYTANTAAGYNYYGDVDVSISFGITLPIRPNTVLLQPLNGTTGVIAVEPVTWDATGIWKIRVHRAIALTNGPGFWMSYFAAY